VKDVKTLAAKTVVASALALGALAAAPVKAGGIPVIDAGNLAQNVMTAVESVAQSLKQIQQYQTQLQQYENMLTNTRVPAAYIWDGANSTITNLRRSTDTLNHYKHTLGSVDAYTSKYQDENFYRRSPCFSAAGCSAAELAAMRNNQRLASEAQKRANDAMFQGLDKQQDAMSADARKLELLQSNAQSSTGQMQAIQNASMLASQQANQLLQIRGLLIAQQNLIATQAQAKADREGKEAAAAEQLRRGTYIASPVHNW
jgi:P-type conjugative transfer protein TrbJ